MASFTRTNGLGHAHATLYSTAQLAAFVLDLGADASGQGGIGGALEAVAQEIGSALLMFDSEGTGGAVSIIVDGHAVNAADLQARIRDLGTVNSYDLSGATVTAGGQITVAA
jgi:hypothetical protein